MKNIAIVGPGFKPVPDVQGGAIEHLITILLEENEIYNKYQFDVYTLSDPLLNTKYYNNTRLIQIVNYQHFLPIRIIFSITNRIFKILNIKKAYNYISCITPYYIKKRYDLILVENNVEMFFRIKKSYPDVKTIFHIHNDFDTVDTDYDKTEKRIIKLEKDVDIIVTASNYLKEHIKTIVDSSKVHVIKNCIDKERFTMTDNLEKKLGILRSRYNISENHFVILFCGRFDRWKGLLELLKSIEMMEDNENVRLLLIGSSWFGSKEEKEYCKSVNKMIDRLKEKVLYCGYISQEKIHEVYAVASLVAIPSQCEEAFGMTALEAISMGKPCVASACGGLLDILDSNCAKLIIRDSRYIQRFAQALDELYKNEELLKRLQEGALIKAQSFSDKKDYYKKFIKILERIINNNIGLKS